MHIKNNTTKINEILNTLNDFPDIYEVRETEKQIIDRTAVEIYNKLASCVGDYAFYGQNKLATIELPACINIGTSAFYSNIALRQISFPICETIGSHAFLKCPALSTAEFQKCFCGLLFFNEYKFSGV